MHGELRYHPGRSRRAAGDAVEVVGDDLDDLAEDVYKRQVGMCLKLPPVSQPVCTTTLPPRMRASTRRRRSAGLSSTKCCSSMISIAAPWLWPVSYTHLDVYKRQLFSRTTTAAGPAPSSGLGAPGAVSALAGGSTAVSVFELITEKLLAWVVPTWILVTFGLAEVPKPDPEIVTG